MLGILFAAHAHNYFPRAVAAAEHVAVFADALC
jgi:hypothetical protein